MKKVVTGVLVGVVVLIVGVVVVGFAMPSEARVERSILVNAKVESVFAQVDTMEKWKGWGGPWQKNPRVTLRFDGPFRGVGSKLFYDHPDTGKGTVEIAESEPNTRVKTKIVFADQGTAHGHWSFVPQGNAVRVSWKIVVPLGANPIKRIVAPLLMDGQVGPEFEMGLARLKAVSEQTKK